MTLCFQWADWSVVGLLAGLVNLRWTLCANAVRSTELVLAGQTRMSCFVNRTSGLQNSALLTLTDALLLTLTFCHQTALLVLLFLLQNGLWHAEDWKRYCKGFSKQDISAFLGSSWRSLWNGTGLVGHYDKSLQKSKTLEDPASELGPSNSWGNRQQEAGHKCSTVPAIGDCTVTKMPNWSPSELCQPVHLMLARWFYYLGCNGG